MAPDEGILVVGSTPEFLPHFISGTIKGGVFKRDTITAEVFAGKPTGGYLVGKVKAKGGSRDFALWGISITALRIVPCGTDILTFPLQAGKIQYVGDFSFRDHGQSISYTRRDDLEAATAYLRQHYPGEKFEVVRAPIAPYSFELPKGEDCGPVTIPIYMGR